MKFHYRFNDVSLSIGTNAAGDRQHAAWIYGIATIECHVVQTDEGESDIDWEIVSVRLLESDADNGNGVAVGWSDHQGQLMDWISESLEHHCGDFIAVLAKGCVGWPGLVQGAVSAEPVHA